MRGKTGRYRGLPPARVDYKSSTLGQLYASSWGWLLAFARPHRRREEDPLRAGKRTSSARSSGARPHRLRNRGRGAWRYGGSGDVRCLLLPLTFAIVYAMGFEVVNAYGCAAHWRSADLRGPRHPGHLPDVARVALVGGRNLLRVQGLGQRVQRIGYRVHRVHRARVRFFCVHHVASSLGAPHLGDGASDSGLDTRGVGRFGRLVTSVGSRSEGSSASEGERTTAAVSVALRLIEMMCANTNAVLADLLAANLAMNEEFNDMRMAQRAGELRRDTLTSGLTGGIQDNRLELKSIFERLGTFEKVLRADAHVSKDTIEITAARSSSVGAAPQSGSISIQVPIPSPELVISGGVKSANIRDAVAKMMLKAMLPQQMFLQQLQDYREVDPLAWNAQFSPGFKGPVCQASSRKSFPMGKLESNGRATS